TMGLSAYRRASPAAKVAPLVVSRRILDRPVRRPCEDANREGTHDGPGGDFAYAKAGFGDYMGFLSAFGYWLGSCLGNVFYWVLISTTLGRFFPQVFGDGTSVGAIIVSLIGVWAFHFMILRGVKEATFVNKVVTVAKIVPLILAVILFVIFFNWSQFAENFFGGVGMPDKSLIAQVRDTMLI